MMGKFDNTPGLTRIFREALQALRPPPNLSPSEWAEQNVRIPVGNAVPGLIRFDNAPFQREPLDMLVDPDCYRITMVWAAQLGNTQVALCGQAYHIAMRPSSQMMMQPSEADLKMWLSAKFQPLVDANPVLSPGGHEQHADEELSRGFSDVRLEWFAQNDAGAFGATDRGGRSGRVRSDARRPSGGTDLATGRHLR